MVYFTQVFLPECVGKPLDFNFEVQRELGCMKSLQR